MSAETEPLVLPARRGRAVLLDVGEAIRIINMYGSNGDEMTEFLSDEHMRATLEKLWPGKGDPQITNRRRPIMVIKDDTFARAPRHAERCL